MKYVFSFLLNFAYYFYFIPHTSIDIFQNKKTTSSYRCTRSFSQLLEMARVSDSEKVAASSLLNKPDDLPAQSFEDILSLMGRMRPKMLFVILGCASGTVL